MAKEATNPKSSIQTEWYCLAVHKITWDIPWSARELRNCPLKKSDFVVSYKLLTSIAYKLKQLLSYFTLWTLIVLGSPFVNWRFCDVTLFWATRSRVQRCAYCACAVPMQCILPLFAYDGCIRGAYRILFNPTSGGSRPLAGIPIICTCSYLL